MYHSNNTNIDDYKILQNKAWKSNFTFYLNKLNLESIMTIPNQKHAYRTVFNWHAPGRMTSKRSYQASITNIFLLGKESIKLKLTWLDQVIYIEFILIWVISKQTNFMGKIRLCFETKSQNLRVKQLFSTCEYQNSNIIPWNGVLYTNKLLLNK